MESFKEFTGDENAVAHQEIYQTGDVNFTAQLTRLRLKMSKEKIDGIVITPPFPQDGPIIAKQAAKLGIKLPVVLTDGADDQTVIEVGGEHIEGALISTHFAAEYPLTENAKKFVEAYQAEYNSEPGAFECLGFDAIQIMIESMETIGKDKWDAMTLEDRRSALRDTIQNHKFVTTTMPISYPDPESVKYPRIPDKPVVFKVVQDGKRVFKDIINPEDLK
jgi:branched-chain amino acid transport system substrate-binding protein